MSSSTRRRCGQATVEAAFAIPLLFALVLLMLQPGIILYDRMVMTNAAAEGCRVLMTQPAGDARAYCASYVLRRLGSIPQQSLFHVHEPACTYEVDCQGGEESETVSVSIENRIEPLPLIGFAGKLLGAVDDDGLFVIQVEVAMQVQPSWVSAGGSPQSWAHSFD